MSLASDYAAAYAATQVELGVPAPFVGPNGRAEVTYSGNLRLIKTAVGGEFEIVPAGALAFAAWITTTFA